VKTLGRRLALPFWEKFASRAIARAHLSPSETDLQALLAESSGEHATAPAIVVVAPDDAELLTLRALRALQSADVILFDRAVAAPILDFARREARRMLVTATDPISANEPVGHETTMVALTRAGRRVVRLVGAEAASIARAEAEIAACRAAGVAVEMVPRVVPPPQEETRHQQSGIRDRSSTKL
jgi:uroporphyrin-III C-methyltransferase / precorrin-2 dehydrogenase / sirohydrochlorin ferrochelatase